MAYRGNDTAMFYRLQKYTHSTDGRHYYQCHFNILWICFFPGNYSTTGILEQRPGSLFYTAVLLSCHWMKTNIGRTPDGDHYLSDLFFRTPHVHNSYRRRILKKRP